MEQITREEIIELLKAVKREDDFFGVFTDTNRIISVGERIDQAITALQAAEPVAWETLEKNSRRTLFHTKSAAERAIMWHGGSTKIAPLFTLPALPALVPEAITDPADSCEVSSLFDHGYKRGWNACRDAMLSAAPQPERIEATDEILDALTSALAAMEHMGDVLNGIDAVEDEDERHFPAFDKVRAAIERIASTPQPEQQEHYPTTDMITEIRTRLVEMEAFYRGTADAHRSVAALSAASEMNQLVEFIDSALAAHQAKQGGEL